MSLLTGRRRGCLVLVESFTTTDGQYGLSKAWASNRQVWVSIDPKRGDERYTANEKESVVTHVIRGDYYDLLGVTPEMRVIFNASMDYSGSPEIPADSKVYQILAVIPDENERGDTMLHVEEEGRTYGELS